MNHHDTIDMGTGGAAAPGEVFTSSWIEPQTFDWHALRARPHRVLRVGKGRAIFTQGDAVRHVYLVAEGRVRLVLLSAAGQEKHLAVVGPQGMVGECSAFLDGRHSVTAIASSALVVHEFARAELQAAVAQDAATLGQVLWLAGSKMRIYAMQNLLLSHATAAQRVAHHLAQLAQTYGRAHAQGTAIGIAFTHQEMANITGISRVMASIVLKQLQQDGLVLRVQGLWVIRDIANLRRRAVGPAGAV